MFWWFTVERTNWRTSEGGSYGERKPNPQENIKM
jgi:hypothetical protein